MSGICGIVDRSGPVGSPALGSLVRAAGNRSLSGAGTWLREGVGFASLGDQRPLAARTGEVLVADARVDNRADLLGCLDVPPGSGDAELILAAYRRWGAGCARHIVGDFAFVVWDSRRRRLFAARDAVGMRTLYFREEPARTLFATEAGQILAVPGVPNRPFEAAVAAHLAGVPGALQWTAWAGIATLPPAHALICDAKGTRVWRYWEPDWERRISAGDEGEYAEQFRELFLEAVRCRLRGAKAVAVVLSGGVDSGSVASSVGWLRERGTFPEVLACCWAFSVLPECDERHVSRGIVDHYDMPLSEVAAEAAWPLGGHPAGGPDRDDPFAGPYQELWQATLEQAAGQGAGVVLSGVRGDLLVGGAVFDELGLLLRGRFAEVVEDLRLHRRDQGASWPRIVTSRLVRPAAAGLWPPGRPGRAADRSALGHPPPEWVLPAFARRAGLADLPRPERPPAALRGRARRQRHEQVAAFMHVRGVEWLARMAARAGVVHADPWSDRRLAEFVLAVPQWALQRRSHLKGIAYQAMRGIVPEPVRPRLAKVTPQPFFNLSLRTWAQDRVWRLLSGMDAAAHGYVDQAALRRHYTEILGGRPPRDEFWWALTLEMWLRHYVS